MNYYDKLDENISKIKHTVAPSSNTPYTPNFDTLGAAGADIANTELRKKEDELKNINKTLGDYETEMKKIEPPKPEGYFESRKWLNDKYFQNISEENMLTNLSARLDVKDLNDKYGEIALKLALIDDPDERAAAQIEYEDQVIAHIASDPRYSEIQAKSAIEEYKKLESSREKILYEAVVAYDSENIKTYTYSLIDNLKNERESFSVDEKIEIAQNLVTAGITAGNLTKDEGNSILTDFADNNFVDFMETRLESTNANPGDPLWAQLENQFVSPDYGFWSDKLGYPPGTMGRAKAIFSSYKSDIKNRIATNALEEQKIRENTKRDYKTFYTASGKKLDGTRITGQKYIYDYLEDNHGAFKTDVFDKLALDLGFQGALEAAYMNGQLNGFSYFSNFEKDSMRKEISDFASDQLVSYQFGMQMRTTGSENFQDLENELVQQDLFELGGFSKELISANMNPSKNLDIRDVTDKINFGNKNGTNINLPVGMFETALKESLDSKKIYNKVSGQVSLILSLKNVPGAENKAKRFERELMALTYASVIQNGMKDSKGNEYVTLGAPNLMEVMMALVTDEEFGSNVESLVEAYTANDGVSLIKEESTGDTIFSSTKLTQDDLENIRNNDINKRGLFKLNTSGLVRITKGLTPDDSSYTKLEEKDLDRLKYAPGSNDSYGYYIDGFDVYTKDEDGFKPFEDTFAASKANQMGYNTKTKTFIDKDGNIYKTNFKPVYTETGMRVDKNTRHLGKIEIDPIKATTMGTLDVGGVKVEDMAIFENYNTELTQKTTEPDKVRVKTSPVSNNIVNRNYNIDPRVATVSNLNPTFAFINSKDLEQKGGYAIIANIESGLNPIAMPKRTLKYPSQAFGYYQITPTLEYDLLKKNEDLIPLRNEIIELAKKAGLKLEGIFPKYSEDKEFMPLRRRDAKEDKKDVGLVNYKEIKNKQLEEMVESYFYELFKRNTDDIIKTLGGSASLTDIYICHNLGITGGKKFKQGVLYDPKGKVSRALGDSSIINNKGFFPKGKDTTFEDAYKAYMKRMDSHIKSFHKASAKNKGIK